MFLTSQRHVVYTEGKCVIVGTMRRVVIVRNSVHVIPLSVFFFSPRIHIETEIDPNLGSSRLQHLKAGALLGSSSTNNL